MSRRQWRVVLLFLTAIATQRLARATVESSFSHLAAAGWRTASFSAVFQSGATQGRQATRTELSTIPSADGSSKLIQASVVSQTSPASGTVIFLSGNTILGEVSLDADGNAVLPIPNGQDELNVVAQYSGDILHNGSSSSQADSAPGNGSPVQIWPADVAFGTHGVGASIQPQTVVVKNVGASDLTIIAAEITGPNSSEFSIVSNTCPGVEAVLPAGKSCKLKISFAPSSTGASAATLRIAEGNTNTSSEVSLTGIAVDGAVATFIPSTLVFPGQVVGVPAAGTIVLQNTGNISLTLNSFALLGSPEFKETTTCALNTPIPPTGECNFTIKLTPGSIGPKSATLVVTDSESDSPHTIAISGNATNAPYLQVSPAPVTFPSIAVGDSSSTVAKITNVGNKALTLSSFQLAGQAASDFAATANGCEGRLKPGSGCTVTITFAPTAIGTRNASLVIRSNALNNTYLLGHTGNAKPSGGGKLSSTKITFPKQGVGVTSAPLSVVLSNTGKTTLSVTGTSISGAYAGDFSVTTSGCSSIAPGFACSISVTFTPTVAAKEAATLAITTNSGTLPKISLSGTGVNGPFLAFAPTTLKFGSEPAGQQSAPQAITLTNTGNAPLILRSLAVIGAQFTDFAESDTCGAPATLAVGASCTATVTFTPASVGKRSATLTATDNASPTTQTATLSGTGTQGTGPLITLQLSQPSIYTFSTGGGTVTIPNPAPSGGQQIFLSSNNSKLFASPGLPTSVTIPAGQVSTNFSFPTSTFSGGAVLTAFADNFQNGTATLTVNERTMTMTLSAAVVGTGRRLTAALRLGQPAPTGGATINLSTADPTIAAISPASVFIAAGTTSSTTAISVTGVQGGSTTVSAQAAAVGILPSGFTGASASVSVSSLLLTLGQNLVLAPGQTLPLPITLSDNGNPIPVSLTSSPTGIVTFPKNPMSNTAQITGAKAGVATITVIDPSGKYASDTATVTVAYALNFSPATTLNVIDFNTATVQLNLSAPAPSPGFTATLSMADSTIATVPSSVKFATGASSVTVTVKGVAVGNTTLSATGTGANTAQVAVSVGPAATLAFSPVTVGKDLEVVEAGTLSEPAPAGNLLVTLTSSDSTKVTLSPDGVTAGTKSITVQVPAGSTSPPPFSIIGLNNSGTYTVTATATGYAPASINVTLAPSGFVINSQDIQTAVGLPDATVTVVPAQLDPATLAVVVSPQTVRAGANFNVTVTSSATAVGTIVTSPVNFTGGTNSASTTFHAVSAGSSNVKVVEPGGFSQPASQTQITAAVSSAGFVGGSSVSIGNNLQLGYSLTLTQPAPAGNLQITATSNSPSLLLSSSTSTLGSGSLSVQVPAGSTSVPTIYLQAFAGTGSAIVTLQAPGYLNSSFTVNFVPSGFVVFGQSCGLVSTISTTTLATATPVVVLIEPLDPNTFQPNLVNTFTYYCAPQITEPFAPGTNPVSVTVTSDTPTVGTITTGTLTFNGGDGDQSTGFLPVAAGSANVNINTPAGYTAPASDQQVAASVVPASMYLSSTTTGQNLQSPLSLSLGTAAPPGNETITLTSADGTMLLLSTDPTVRGTPTLNVIIYAQKYSPTATIYAQALGGSGSVNVTASAPDFGTVTTGVPLVPSGFVTEAEVYGSPGSFTITPYSPDQGLDILAVPLDPNTQAAPYICGYLPYCNPSQPLMPGVGPVNVNLNSSDTGVGSITTDPAVFNTGDSVQTTTFHPISTGSSTISLTPTAGFTTPSNEQQVAATVSNGAVYLYASNVGAQLETPVSTSLGVPSPNGTVITVTSGNPSLLVLSTDPTIPGTASVQLTVQPGAGSSTTPVYAQALAGSGSVTLTATSPGYDAASTAVNLVPSGFVIATTSCWASSFSTTPLSGAQTLAVLPVPLDPSTLNFTGASCYSYSSQQIAPGFGPLTIAVTNSNGGAGSITTTPLTFNVGDSVQYTAFQPASTGTSTIGLGTPSVPGFVTPSNYQQVAATVVNPVISISAGNLGVNLEAQVGVSLSQPAPATGEMVTVTSSDPSTVVLSTDPTVQGSASVQVNIASGSYSPSISVYAQALATGGTVNLTASGSSFDPGSASISIVPSGFVLLANYCPTSVSTTLLSGGTNLTVWATTLDPTTLNASPYSDPYSYPYCFPSYPSPSYTQLLAPGVGPVNVTVNNSNASVCSVTATPVTFQTNTNSQTTGFTPTSNGNTNVSINTPSGFSTPSNYQQVAISVVPASINANNISVGRFMEVSTSISLGAPAPSTGLTVTVTSADPTKVQFSTALNIAGSALISFNLNPGDTATPAFYVQATCSQGGSSCTGSKGIGNIAYTVVAPGYATAQATVSVMPSGFAFQNIGTSFSTTTSSAATTLTVIPVALDPTYLTVVDYETLVPGVGQTSVSVLTSATCNGTLNQTVGAITVSPVVFMGADNPDYQTTSFQPLAQGSDVIYIPAPAGFSQASTGNCVTANVTQ